MYVKNSAGPFIDGPDFGKKNRALRDLDADFFCESKMTFVTFQGSGKLEIDRGRTATVARWESRAMQKNLAL